MITQLIILSIAAISLFLFLYFYARKKMRKEGHQMSGEPYRAALENLANYYPGYLSKFYRFFENGALVFIGQYSGCEFRVSFSPATSPMLVPPTKLFMTCRIPSKSKLKIFIYKQNPTAVFLAKRIEIADHELSAFFIYSNKPDEARRFFADENKRILLKQFIKDGWEPPQIICNRIDISRDIKDHQLDPNFVKAILNKMIDLSATHGATVQQNKDDLIYNPSLSSRLPKFPDASRFALVILGATITIKLCIALLTSNFASSDLFTVQGKIENIYIGGEGKPTYIDLESSGYVNRYNSLLGRVWPGMLSLKKGELIIMKAWEQGQVGKFRDSRPHLYIWQLTRGNEVIINGDDISKLKNENNDTEARFGNWVFLIGTILAALVYSSRLMTRSNTTDGKKTN